MAFDVSEKCRDREEMKYDAAENFEEAVLLAAKMLNDEMFWVD